MNITEGVDMLIVSVFTGDSDGKCQEDTDNGKANEEACSISSY